MFSRLLIISLILLPLIDLQAADTSQIWEVDDLLKAKSDSVVLRDRDGIILPDQGKADDYIIPFLSGFNPAKELYPAGQQTISVKVQETMELITRIVDTYPSLYGLSLIHI